VLEGLPCTDFVADWRAMIQPISFEIHGILSLSRIAILLAPERGQCLDYRTHGGS
jgi:hypothetical protein